MRFHFARPCGLDLESLVERTTLVSNFDTIDWIGVERLLIFFLDSEIIRNRTTKTRYV